MIKNFRAKVLAWYQQYGRKDLPWQSNPNPYRVWVSEIMLQQTQVNTVIPYFQKFINRFKSVTQLANADLDEVLQHWSGLGYYARARNLHKTAKIIVENYHKRFPQELKTLQQLPGIGRSTAAAILSLANNQAEAILDGNVKRVLARCHAIAGWPGDKKVLDQLWQVAELYIVNDDHARDYTQAMMDLGAMICTRSQPRCQQCPLQKDCQANKQQQTLLFPGKKTSKNLPTKQTYFLILQHRGKILLEKRPPVGIWGGLWCFPMLENISELTTVCEKDYALDIKNQHCLANFRHTFSHFHLDITPVIVKATPKINQIKDDQIIWYHSGLSKPLGLSKPVANLLATLYEEKLT